MRGLFWNVVRAILFLESAHRAYLQRIDSFQTKLQENLDDGLPLDAFRRTITQRMAQEMFKVMMPILFIGMVSPNLIVSSQTAEVRSLADKLRLGLTGDVVVEMGIALFHLARLLDRSDFEDLNRLAERIQQRRMSPEFLGAWDDFLSRFGWRGPLEMDLGSPRYADHTRLALRQMSFMAVDNQDFDREEAQRRQIEKRQRAYQELMRRSGPLRRMLLRRVDRLIDLFGGTRATPKHLVVLFNYAGRRRALIEGRRLTREGQLEAAEHVFDPRFEDLEAAAQDVTLDLRKIREERTRFQKKLSTHARWFPPVIDSRGRILRPPPAKEVPGLLKRMPVSPGVVAGPVKVLHSPNEKPVGKGDVLVAYTTDPDWTPLFVNAAAIVLEVGGRLPHGAVVAREYRKPCVVSIDRVVAKLHDGEPVEVNGTMGTVRVLS